MPQTVVDFTRNGMGMGVGVGMPGGPPVAFYPLAGQFAPAFANGGDQYVAYYPQVALPQQFPMRGEHGLAGSNGRRLGDRIGGYMPGMEGPGQHPGHGIEGLPAKPVMALDSALTAGSGSGGRRGGAGSGVGRVMPPPPPDAKEDPRAAAGRKVSYHDMDLVAEGDVELNY